MLRNSFRATQPANRTYRRSTSRMNLGAAGELGHGLGSFGDGVLGQFTGEHESDSSLDFTAAESGLLAVGRELSGLGSDALEDIVDEGVHDGHTLLGNTGVGVDLFENLVDVRRVRFRALLALSLGAGGLLGCLSRLLGGCLCHGEGV